YVTLRDRRPKPLTILQASTTSAHVTARCDAASRAQETVTDSAHWAQRVRLHIGPDYPEGRHQETLSLFTTDPDYRELRVPFTVVKHARTHVMAAPASVD